MKIDIKEFLGDQYEAYLKLKKSQPSKEKQYNINSNNRFGGSLGDIKLAESKANTNSYWKNTENLSLQETNKSNKHSQNILKAQQNLGTGIYTPPGSFKHPKTFSKETSPQETRAYNNFWGKQEETQQTPSWTDLNNFKGTQQNSPAYNSFWGIKEKAPENLETSENPGSWADFSIYDSSKVDKNSSETNSSPDFDVNKENYPSFSYIK